MPGIDYLCQIVETIVVEEDENSHFKFFLHGLDHVGDVQQLRHPGVEQ